MVSNKDIHLAPGYVYIKEIKTSRVIPYYIYKVFVKYPQGLSHNGQLYTEIIMKTSCTFAV